MSSFLQFVRRPQVVHFLLALAVYVVCPPFTSHDSFWTVPVAAGLPDLDTTIDRYLPHMPKEASYAVECVQPGKTAVLYVASPGACQGGHAYNFFPVAVSVIAAPAVGVIQAGTSILAPVLAPLAPPGRPVLAAFLAGDLYGGHAVVELLAASLLAALASALMYLIAARFLSPRGATLLTLLFSFGTASWSISSRSLMQHGPSVFCLTLALYLILRGSDDPRFVPFAALPLAAACTIRPTNVISLVVLTGWVALQHRQLLKRFLLWTLPVAFCFFTYNLATRHEFLPLYFRTTPEYWLVDMASGLAAQLLSPSRGLFVFTPVFLFSLPGFFLALRTRWLFPLAPCLAGIMVLHALAVSPWLPGHCYGSRYFTDLTHLYVLFLIPVIIAWSKRPKSAGRNALALVFVICCLFGAFVHFRGATSAAAQGWSKDPVDVDTAPGRVWDWRDPQFLRGL